MKKYNNFNHQWFMRLAIEEAEKAFSLGEVPVGAIIVDDENKIISKSHNFKEQSHDPCGHAEILAIREASKNLSSWRLNNCTIYVTLEPCVMCMGAIISSRLNKVIFGAYDLKGGAISLGFNLHHNSKLNHRSKILGGVEHYDCSSLLSQFFKQRRSLYQK